MPVLYFFRHGETDWNADGRLQGKTDIPLNEKGRFQARGIGDAVRAGRIHGLTPDRLATMPFISSPLGRTRETMELMRVSLGLTPDAYQTDDRLKEIGFGQWEGKLWRDIQNIDPAGLRARDRDKWNYTPSGGESYEMVARRVGEWVASLSGDACVVAHGGVARVLLVLMAGMARENAVAENIWQGKLLEIGGGRHFWKPGPGHLEPI